MSAIGVVAARPASQSGRGGSNPTIALQSLQVRIVPKRVAAALLVRNHYLHSAAAGTHLAFGVFLGHRLLGAVTLGIGSKNAHRLVDSAASDECLTLTRLWLSDRLPVNSESRVLGVVARLLRRHTSVRFLVSYADPAAGHIGIVYQASGWLYAGLSDAMALYDLGDGAHHHSRSLSYNLGSHSLTYLRSKGVTITKVAQEPKHRYVLPLRPGVAERLTVPMLSYPKKETTA